MIIVRWATLWENLFIPYVNNKGADQPAHSRSLISAFVVCCLNVKTLTSLCSWAGQFESYLVANPQRQVFLVTWLRWYRSRHFFLPFEPWRDKTNKMSVHPAKTWISLGIRPVWSESLLCTHWVAKDPRFLHEDSEDSDQTGRCPGWPESSLDAHSLCWFVMSRLIYVNFACKQTLQYIIKNIYHKKDI